MATLQRRNIPRNVRKPGKTALEGSLRSLRDGIDGFTGKENFRRFIMIAKLIIEVLIMWILYAIYMAILVHGKGPVGGIFFYPMAMQDRVVELGLTTKDKIKRGKTFAFVLLFVWMFVAPMIMILIVNRTRSYLGCCIQFYILFLGAEFFDWLVIDTIWVAMSDWWLIPGTEDLNDTWHNVNVKKWKFVKLIPFSVPVVAIVGGIYFLIGKIF